MLDYFYSSGHLYTAMEMQRMVLGPVNTAAWMGKELLKSAVNPLAYTEAGRQIAAGFELLERFTRIYTRPEFNIHETKVGNRKVPIEYKIVAKRTFGRLLQFKKVGFEKELPKLLIVAPLSGHFSTLCRGTVEDCLPFFDVYITDWQNASDVPVSKGKFDLDSYIDYVMYFLKKMGPNVHVMAVCQPVVPVMAAASLMNTMNDANAPASIILIGGPIDGRVNATEVNRLAQKRSLEWFKQNVISVVPFNYRGFGRPVYPGFVQLTGFMTMNLDRHIQAHKDLFGHLVEGDGDSVTAHKKFYNEYLAVMDIPAEFYLQTIETVFQKFDLPEGKMMWKNKPVRPQDITKTAILTIEGERDDISGRGQTQAALKLCTSLPDKMKMHHLQKNVGHYGTFNGRRFREEIMPVIRNFTKKFDK